MVAQETFSIQRLQRQAASLLLYQSVLEGAIGQAFLALLRAIQSPDQNSIQCLRAYGHWFNVLASEGLSWQDYLLLQILKSENPFTRQAQRIGLTDLPPALIAAVQHDLRSLQQLYSCDGAQLSRQVQEVSGLENPPIVWDQAQRQPSYAVNLSQLPVWSKFEAVPDWADVLAELAAYYRQFGVGLFMTYRAFRWQSGTLAGITHPDPIQLHELVGYETQKATLVKNTEALLAGYPALHVLLYGSRGSGKSSLVKALLQAYEHRGLRLIEVRKGDLRDLPTIVDRLRDVPQTFILFVDDLSFEEDDDAYKALKVGLEGNITARPQNIVVYATSNRRHLIREFFGDRPRPSNADEVHAWDTVQEKLSFSDRFGLTLTFEPANQNTYLEIVCHLAQQAGISIEPNNLEFRALQWATRHNGRSGRTARQFVDFLQAEVKMKDE
ncbi:MAG: ATP-binding protein [Cyanobacteria bacterium RU_5_0]|nr:ATP-binding protein [Cyanobacteria bacterium RU_5_0]